MRKYLPLSVLFVFFSLVLVIFREKLTGMGLDTRFTLFANVILFAVTILGFVIISGNAGSKSIHAFLRGVYLSFLLKMFVVVAALFIFISVFKEVNKPAIFVSMGLYIVYSIVEVFQLMKIGGNTQK